MSRQTGEPRALSRERAINVRWEQLQTVAGAQGGEHHRENEADQEIDGIIS
jgi:hypothetical protein